MSIYKEGQTLGAEIAVAGGSRYQRYTPELRERVVEWFARATTAGLSDSECSRLVGIRRKRLVDWRAQRPLALVRVETIQQREPTAALVVSGFGVRVGGLTVEQVVAIFRGLS